MILRAGVFDSIPIANVSALQGSIRMRVAITGASGLIGTELMRSMAGTDLIPIGLSRKENKGAQFVKCDYSRKSLTSVFSTADAVVQLAAVRGGEGKSYKEYQENEELMETVLYAMQDTGIERLIYMSSISVYSDTMLIPWNERHALNPTTLYGISKLKGEYLCNLFEKRGIRPCIFRCAHVLGLEEKGYMLSKFLNGAYNGEELTVKGKSIAKREFIYIKDVCDAIIWALQNDNVQGTYNLGSGVGYTNLEIAQYINTVFENKTGIRYESQIDEGIQSSIMDVTKIRNAGFKLQYNILSAVEDIRKEKFIKLRQ